MEEVTPGVYAFDLFTLEFCQGVLLEEIDAYMQSGLPLRRPNSMNNYGLIVNEIGLVSNQALSFCCVSAVFLSKTVPFRAVPLPQEPFISAVQLKVLGPIAALLYPEVGPRLDRHHSFMVAYTVGQDRGLDMYTDDR
eukprot:SAG22_NODE_1252_length_5005_cov_1.761313_6_plen_137_part_00